MFEASFKSANVLKKIVDAIKDLVDDANFEIDENGIHIQAMDSSHISLISLELLSSMFIHYNCDVKTTLGISLQNLSKILKCAGNDDILTLKTNTDSEILQILFETSTQNRISEFELKLIDIDAEGLSIPEQEFDSTVKIVSSEFHRIIRDMIQIGDNCSICCEKNYIKFTVNGDIGNGNITLCKNDDYDEDGIRSISVRNTVKHDFALRHLSLFTKATTLSEEVIISMTNDMPIVLRYNIKENGEAHHGHLSYFLAPKTNDIHE